MEDFKRYKDLKARLDFVFHGVHLNRVAAAYIWDVANNPENQRFSLRAIASIFAAIAPQFKRLPKEKNIYYTFGTYHRRDHKELNDAVLRKINEDNVFRDEILKWKVHFVFHPIIIIRVLRFILKSKWRGEKMLDRLAIACKYVNYINSLLELEKIDFSNIRKYLSQSNVLNYENLLTQFFNLRNVQTLSLTEGIYVVQKEHKTIDCLQYENFDADKYLMWGQSSIDEFLSENIPNDKLVVAGYPKDNKRLDMKQNNSFRECMVLMCREQFHDSNDNLLKILSKYSNEIHFQLKLHPGSNPTLYEKYIKEYGMSIIPVERTINECLNNKIFDFAVAVNTNAYYEALMRGVPCLRFKDDTFQLPAGFDDIFKDFQDFDQKFENIKNLSQGKEYQEQINEVLKYCIGVGIDNYRKIIME